MSVERVAVPIFKESDKPRHECGVVGIWAPKEEVSRLAFYSLYRLQHRGQESAGIAVLSDTGIDDIKRMGLLRESFTEQDIDSLNGYAAIGHTRYSNTGGSNIANAQPAIYQDIAISENGNLVNPLELRVDLAKRGIYPSDTQGISCSSDGEIIAQVISTAEGSDIVEKIQKASEKFQGAYSLTILAENSLIALKDPKGVWPLCLGKLNGSGYVVASESSAFSLINAQFIREIEPGEIVVINEKGVKSYKLPSDGKTAECAFDWTYFRRPDSLVAQDRYAFEFRKDLGRQVAIDFPVEADVVIGEKDSGTFGAHGFSEESGIPFSEGSIKDPYSKRTFIDPSRRIRDTLVDLKHSFLVPEISGKRVAFITDTIVRGTNTRGNVRALRNAGALEIHVRVTYPPITDPCFYGIDMESKDALIASGRTTEEVRQEIGADTLAYQKPESFEKVLRRSLNSFCTACFTGRYPIPVPQMRDKFELEQELIEVSKI